MYALPWRPDGFGGLRLVPLVGGSPVGGAPYGRRNTSHIPTGSPRPPPRGHHRPHVHSSASCEVSTYGAASSWVSSAAAIHRRTPSASGIRTGRRVPTPGHAFRRVSVDV